MSEYTWEFPTTAPATPAVTTAAEGDVDHVTEALDRVHTTAESHDRVIVVEVMGRQCGYLALMAALATVETILEEGLVENSRRVGAHMLARLERMKERLTDEQLKSVEESMAALKKEMEAKGFVKPIVASLAGDVEAELKRIGHSLSPLEIVVVIVLVFLVFFLFLVAE